jgi:hypothetical protein
MPYRFTALESPTFTLASFSQISCCRKANYHRLRESFSSVLPNLESSHTGQKRTVVNVCVCRSLPPTVEAVYSLHSQSYSA